MISETSSLPFCYVIEMLRNLQEVLLFYQTNLFIKASELLNQKIIETRYFEQQYGSSQSENVNSRSSNQLDSKNIHRAKTLKEQ